MPHHKTEFCMCAFLTLSVLIWREHTISSLSICYVPSSKHMVFSDFSCSFQYELCAQCKLYTSINICLFIWRLMTDSMGKKCIAYCPFGAKHSFPQKMNLASGQEISWPQPCRESVLKMSSRSWPNKSSSLFNSIWYWWVAKFWKN